MPLVLTFNTTEHVTALVSLGLFKLTVALAGMISLYEWKFAKNIAYIVSVPQQHSLVFYYYALLLGERFNWL